MADGNWGVTAQEGNVGKARKELLFGNQQPRDGDRFNIIKFAGEEHLMERHLSAANAEGKRRGEEFVKKLAPNGGTNINDSLIASMKQFERGDRLQSRTGLKIQRQRAIGLVC